MKKEFQTAFGPVGLLCCVFANPVLAEEDKIGAAVEEPVEEKVELDAIRITAKEDTPQTISAPKLLRVPGAGGDPLRAIEALPGVVFSNGRRSEPAVRGSSPQDNKYLIDYLPVENIFHFDGSSLLNDNVVEDFKLEAAAFDAQYTNATGAVIDTTSRAPYSDQAQAVVDLSLLKASLLLETPITENQSAYLSIRQSLIQFYIENFLDDEDFKFTTVPEYYDYQGKYQLRLNDTDTLTLQAIGARDKAGILFEDDSDEVKKDPSLAGGLSFSSDFHTQGAIWERYLNSGGIHLSSLSHKVSDISFLVGQAGDLKATSNEFSLFSKMSIPLNISHNLRFGFEYVENHISFDGDLNTPPCTELQPDCRLEDTQERVVSSDKLIIYNTDLFMADDWDVSDRLTLTPGIQLSHDDYSGQFFAQPKFKSRWQFVDNWWFNAAFGQYHKFTDNFGQVAEGFGNPDLKQSTADHYLLGIENQISESLLWKIDTYYKTFDDLSVARLSKDHVLYAGLSDAEYASIPRYDNNADGDAYGLEVFVNKSFSDGWYGWLSVAYAETRRKNTLTGESFKYNYDQPWIVNLVSSHELNENWTLGVKWRFQSGQLVTPVVNALPDPTNTELYHPVYGDLNSERLPAYHKMDVRLDRDFHYLNWDMDLYIEVLNVYNRANVTDYEYEPDYSAKEDVTDLPLLVSVGIKATF